MSREDRERWDARYREGAGGSHGPRRLEALLGLLKPGRALDIACGSGAAGAILARAGWWVAGADISRPALHGARARHPEMALVLADMERFHVRPGALDTVVCTYYLDRQLLARAAGWLTGGGTLYLETFTEDHLRHRPGFRREFLLRRGEAPTLAAGLEVIHGEETDDGSAAFAVLVARR